MKELKVTAIEKSLF